MKFILAVCVSALPYTINNHARIPEASLLRNVYDFEPENYSHELKVLFTNKYEEDDGYDVDFDESEYQDEESASDRLPMVASIFGYPKRAPKPRYPDRRNPLVEGGGPEDRRKTIPPVQKTMYQTQMILILKKLLQAKYFVEDQSLLTIQEADNFHLPAANQSLLTIQEANNLSLPENRSSGIPKRCNFHLTSRTMRLCEREILSSTQMA